MQRVIRLSGVCLFALAWVLVFAAPAAAQFDRGQISGTVKDAQGGVVPGRHRHRHQHADADSALDRHRRRAASTRSRTCCPAATTSAPSCRASRKSSAPDVQLDAAGALDDRLRARDRRAHRSRSRSPPKPPPLQTDVGAPQDRRGQRHRAALVPGPQPDRRGRPEGRRHRRQLQQPRLRRPRQRRLQHQRQPQRREQHHGRRRHRHPHALGRRDHRHPERRRRPGSPGPDRQLHARVRPRQRRADPLRHQERQQPLQRQRVVLLPRRQRCRPTPGRATAARTPIENSGPAPFDYKQYGYSFGGPIPAACSRTSCSSSARRSGSTSSQVADQHRRPCRPRRCARGDFSELLNPSQRLLQRARRSSATR